MTKTSTNGKANALVNKPCPALEETTTASAAIFDRDETIETKPRPSISLQIETRPTSVVGLNRLSNGDLGGSLADAELGKNTIQDMFRTQDTRNGPDMTCGQS